MKNLCLALCLIFLFSCSAKKEAAEPASQSAWVILPGNFIIDVAAGSRVVLNPQRQDFLVFDSTQKARKALDGVDAGQAEEWRIYRLDGTFAELARPCGNGQHCLSVPARVTDWIK